MRENSFIRGINDIATMAGKEAESLTSAIGSMYGNFFPQGYDAPMGAAPLNPQNNSTANGEALLVPGTQVASTNEDDAFGAALNNTMGLTQGQPMFQPAKVVHINQGMTRRHPIQPDLEQNIGMAVGAVYGPGYEARVYSGGQLSAEQAKKAGEDRIGTVRHDGGRAADVRIYDPDGNQVKGSALAPLAQFWKATGIGGVGLEMRGGGVHLDNWITPPNGGGMSWAYGELTPEQQVALNRGAARELPQLAQDWSADLIAMSDDPDRAVTLNNVYNTLTDGILSSSGTGDAGTSDPRVTLDGGTPRGGSGGRTARQAFEVEAALGGMLDDMYGKTDYDDQMKRDGKASILEVMSVGLGQMSRGDRVDVSGVLRAQEARNQQIVQNRMQRMRAQSGAEMVLQQGGSIQMAQALASGAISYGDILNERQISNAEAEIARRNAKDEKVSVAMQTALTGMGYSPEMVAAGMADPGTFFKLADLQKANDAAELERLKVEQTKTFRQNAAQEMAASEDPIMRQASTIMVQSGLTMDPNDAIEAAQQRVTRNQTIASNERTAASDAAESAAREQALVDAEVFTNEIASAAEKGVEIPDLYAEINRQLRLNPGALTIPEAEDRALKALAAKKTERDPEFVRKIQELQKITNPETGQFFTEEEAGARILLSSNEDALERRFNDGRARAAERGPEALAAFDAAYPNGPMDYDLVKAGRLGGLEDKPLGTPTIAAMPIPPKGEVNPGSVLDVVGNLSGVQGAVRSGYRSTIGQLTGDPDAAFTKSQVLFNSFRADMVANSKSSARLLAQELQMILRDVAPEESLFTSPGELRNRVEAVDTTLRNRLDYHQRRLEQLRAHGARDVTIDEAIDAIIGLEGALESLHRPHPELMGDAQEGGTINLPDGTTETIDYTPPRFQTETDMDAAFDGLASGTYFIGPDGKLRKKP